MKKILTIVFLVFFAASNLLMPYANYEDTRSLGIVYNACLATDSDMDFLEFVGEKLLSMGFEEAGKDEEDGATKTQRPVNSGIIVQIQSGVLYQQPQPGTLVVQVPVAIPVIPLINTVIGSQKFLPGIFRPPTAAAA